MSVIDAYIRDVLKGGQRRPGTLESAENTFRHFDRWRAEADKGAPETLTRADMREWKAWLLEQFHTNTARKHWVRTGALYRYLLAEEVIEKNPTIGIELPILTKKAPRTYAMQDFRRMLKACTSSLDRLIFFAFVFTGMREGEVMALAWKPAPDHDRETRSFVDLEHGYIVITGGKGARGGKDRNIPIHPLLEKELRLYLSYDGAIEEKWIPLVTYKEEWLFSDRQVVRRTMRRLFKESSTPGAEQQIRKTVLTWMDRHGVRPVVAKGIVGHTGDGVTENHYLATDDAEKKEAIRGLFAGELEGTEAPAPAPALNGNGNGGLNLSGLTTEQTSAVESMIAAFRGKEAVTA